MSDLRSEAVTLLNQVTTTYVRLHVAVTGPRLVGGSGPRVGGGTRNYVPINVEAEEFATGLHDHVTQLHEYVAEKFGEHARSASLQTACGDLVRWSDIWTRLTEAPELVEALRNRLAHADKITGHSTEPTRLYVVCPHCLRVGGMYLSDGNGDSVDLYGCDGCGTTWSPDGYRQAITDALAAHTSVA